MALSTVVFARAIKERALSLSQWCSEATSASILTVAFALLIFGSTLHVSLYLLDNISKFDVATIYAAKDKLVSYIGTTPSFTSVSKGKEQRMD